jgi:DNA-binding MarR family transcriptional regulator
MEREKLIKEIIQLQHQLMYAMGRDESMVWMELNLTIAQLKSLLFIYFEGTTNCIKLATALRVTPPNVTGIINRLVEQELVTREENPQDRRTSILRATETGKALIEGLRESGINRMAIILGKLSTEDLTTLEIGLTALVRNAEDNKE